LIDEKKDKLSEFSGKSLPKFLKYLDSFVLILMNIFREAQENQAMNDQMMLK